MPFGPYSSFKDCVSKNQDKNNPSGYCASIEKKITGKWPGEKGEKEKASCSKEHAIMKNLDTENPPRGVKIGGPIAEYARRNQVKRVDKSEGVERKGRKTKKEKPKGRIRTVGDKVKSGKYGIGTVVKKSKRAKKLDMITVKFKNKNIGRKDVHPKSVTIVKKHDE